MVKRLFPILLVVYALAGCNTQLEPPPVEEIPDEGTPVDDVPLEETSQTEADAPEYKVTIKGAERLDSPALPDLPDE